jgi:hypothetical protein
MMPYMMRYLIQIIHRMLYSNIYIEAEMFAHA